MRGEVQQLTYNVNSLFRLSLLIILVFTIVAFSYSSPLLLAQNSSYSSSSQPPAAFVKSFEKLVKEDSQSNAELPK